MPNESVLVVDDDREIVRLLRGYLEQAGYHVSSAGDGEEALHQLHAAQPDLLVLDLMLPHRDGWDLTRTIRADSRLAGLPIIMLTARVEDVDKIVGLELGADDYVTKPFNPREVVARVNALLRRARRSSSPASGILTVGELVMNIDRHEVRVEGRVVDLTVTEFNILHVMMDNPGYAFTRGELIERSMGYVYDGMERTLDSHVKNLRQKIERDPRQPEYIQTVYGVGYRIAESPGTESP